VIGCALLLPPPAPAVALDGRDSLVDPGRAHIRRELRRLERQAPTDGRGVAREAERLRRSPDLGPAYRADPQDLRLDRELRQLGVRPPPAAPAALPPEPRRVPSFEAAEPLAPARDRLWTVGQLVGRAEGSLLTGRTAAARSDLATAQRLWAALGHDQTDGPDGRELRRRLDELQGRLGP
jgi:hypothetical protein